MRPMNFSFSLMRNSKQHRIDRTLMRLTTCMTCGLVVNKQINANQLQLRYYVTKYYRDFNWLHTFSCYSFSFFDGLPELPKRKKKEKKLASWKKAEKEKACHQTRPKHVWKSTDKVNALNVWQKTRGNGMHCTCECDCCEMTCEINNLKHESLNHEW